jgi:glycosyltransferase involved in cell wall biosynthesis
VSVGGPLVSVIVPAFNAEAFLAEALRSILAQGHNELEIAVVDDGSTDGTARIAAAFGPPVRYLRQDNRGPAAARNTGLAATTGSLVAFLDADDLWPEGSLRVRLDFLARHPDHAAVHGRVRDLWPDLLGPGRHQLDPPRASFAFNVGSALFRRSLFITIGGFDETLRHGEDVDLLVRAAAHGLSRHQLDDVTLIYRRRLADDIGARRRFIHGLAGALKRTLDAGRTRS